MDKCTLRFEKYKLKGKRLVSYQELKRDDRLCSATIKKLTGGDTMNSRVLYKEPEEFKINALQIASTNQLPVMSYYYRACVNRSHSDKVNPVVIRKIEACPDIRLFNLSIFPKLMLTEKSVS